MPATKPPLAVAAGVSAIARALFAGASPAASAGGGVQVQRAVRVVVATVTSDDSGPCAGADGQYLSLDVHLKGVETSLDPRLASNFAGHVLGVFKEQLGADLLIGDARDDFEVRDDQGGLKLKGTAIVIGDGVKALKGLVLASLADGSTLVSSVNGLQTLIIAEEVARRTGLGGLLSGLGVPIPFVVEFGGPATFNPTDEGAVRSGSCPSGFDPSPLVPAS